MRSSYRSLVQLRLRHPYFTDGQCTDECRIEPAPRTRTLLQSRGLGFRASPDACAIFAEVEPGASPPKPWHPIGEEPLKFVLLIEPRSGSFEQITALPPHRPSVSVFHVANLFDKQSSGRLLLTDVASHTSFREPVQLVTSPAYTYAVKNPQRALTLAATDMFGKVTPIPLAPDTEKLTSVRLDLSKIEGITAGLCTLADSGGGSVRIYWDTTLSGKAPLVIAEVFSNTTPLTADGQERVPEPYRFLPDGEVHPKDYCVEFEGLATIWRYNVSKRSDKNKIQLDQLSVAGPAGAVGFTRALQDNHAIFTSNTAIALAEKPYKFKLQHNGADIQKLPNPSIGASLRKGEGAGAIVSEVNVYV